MHEIPVAATDVRRKQCISDLLLNWLLSIYFKNKANGKYHGNFCVGKNANNNTLLLALCNFYAHSNGFNLASDQANLNGNVVAIYLPRLRQEFFVLEGNDELYLKRVVKEAA